MFGRYSPQQRRGESLGYFGIKNHFSRRFSKLNTEVMIRAHGEPPQSYQTAQKNNISLIDATCPVVLKLQKTFKNSFEAEEFQDGQILIFGKASPAEVIGLLGQTQNKGLVISSLSDIDKIDYHRRRNYIHKPPKVWKNKAIVQTIQEKYAQIGNQALFHYYDTICYRVANRAKEIRDFASKYDKVIFVSGEKSSNGLYLFDICKEINPHSYFIYRQEQLNNIPFNIKDKVGICGATSTPMWLMQAIAEKIKHLPLP